MGSAQGTAPRKRRRSWLWWTSGLALALFAALAVLAGLLTAIAHNAEPYLRARIVEGLSRHFHARVELDTFHVSLANGLHGEWGVWARGGGLRIWPPVQVGGVQVPSPTQPDLPLVQLAQFGFHAPLRYKSGQPISISAVHLQGLEIHLPPRSHFIHVNPAQGAAPPAGSKGSALPVRFEIGNLDCSGAHIVLESSKPGKLPMEIAIAQLHLTHIMPDEAMRFEAELTNPRPVGAIHTKGTFGPWQVEDPGESPLAGDYSFDHADLSTFRGIAGILDSTGSYSGTLRNIEVEGQTNTPDFRLTTSDNVSELKTHFHANVDGTNGDTWLSPVDATLGHSHILARGQVVRVLAPASEGPPHSIGHDIDLKISIDHGHIEDFVRIATKGSTSLLTGDLVLNSTLHIPPAQVPVLDRLTMDGSFTLSGAQFTSPKVQDRIAELSLRGQGKPKDVKSTEAGSIASTMQSDFKVAAGKVSLPNLDFTVPGADIQLKGSYGLVDGTIGFAGTARMEATVSKMVGGWKGFLLKPADRFFKGDGAGTEVPVHVDGTREHPEFGVDLKQMKHGSAQHPDEQTHPQSPADQPQPPSTDSPSKQAKRTATQSSADQQTHPQSPADQPQP
ncbi:MAG TPA: hypothetical protein VK716_18435 [Terracidiphilus sp.]|nr:hypothetical protein [Terracidiphilus sp.]